jgi:hypothetical protein
MSEAILSDCWVRASDPVQCRQHNQLLVFCAYLAGQLAMRERAANLVLDIERDVLKTHGAAFVTFGSTVEAICALAPEGRNLTPAAQAVLEAAVRFEEGLNRSHPEREEREMNARLQEFQDLLTAIRRYQEEQ